MIERTLAALCERLGIAVPPEARPEAAPAEHEPVLLRTADGWFHPGPDHVREDVGRMIDGLGGDVRSLPAEVIDAEAGRWMLPAAAVRPRTRRDVEVPDLSAPRLDGATVVVLGAMWAVPLAALTLARLGARVIRVHHPGRPDAFVLRDRLAVDQEHVELDLIDGRHRDRFLGLVTAADAFIDGNTPRVLRNFGIAPPVAQHWSVTALRDDDRPGYGAVAECRAGWAARSDPPKLERTTVADPVAGLLVALRVTSALIDGQRDLAARVGLDDAVELVFQLEGRSATAAPTERRAASAPSASS